MRRVAVDGLVYALLWLAHCNSSVAQSSKSNNEIDKENIISTSTSSNVDTTLLITTTTSSLSSSYTPLVGPSTCRSGTVNHITYSLPQTCLTSSWTAPVPALSTSSANDHDATTSSDASPSDDRSGNTIGSSQSYTTPASESIISQTTSTKSDTTSSISTTQFDSTTDIVPSVSESFHSSATPEAAPTDTEAEIETDSPLDNANFLSFEDWKKQNLAKAGQSPDGGQQARSGSNGHGRPRPDVALDALGDEGEIVLDFSGFGSGSREEEADKTKASNKASSSTTDSLSSSGPALRSKDAGKTCKERSNYASFDCAATILKTNPEAKSSSAILIENKDSYMLNSCSASNKFIIVELCDDILIDTIVLANYEFFSSIFRTFRVSVSDRYPVKSDRWKELGTFEARNSRSVQAFLVEHSLIWARYLRIEFLTHFGSEYYCPVSLLRVHGTTMMEEFRHQEEINRGENLDDSEDELVPIIEERPIASESPNQEHVAMSIEADKTPVAEPDPPAPSSSEAVTSHTGESDITPSSPASTLTTAVASSDHLDTTQVLIVEPSQLTSQTVLEEPEQTTNVTSTTHFTSSMPPLQQTSHQQAITSQTTSQGKTFDPPLQSSMQSDTTTTPSSSLSKESSDNTTLDTAPNSTTTVHSTSDKKISNMNAESASSPISTESVSYDFIESAPTHIESSSASSGSQTSLSSIAPLSSESVSSSSSSPPRQNNTSLTPPQQQKQPGPSVSSSAPQANPTTQESFFKSIHKRLQTLESNATLSLQYIESQSLLLRTAFQAVEKRQLKKTENFLASLNASVTTELEKFKSDYERLWEGVVIEMETQRRQNEREILAVSDRLRVMAEELVWQRWVGVVQSTLLLLCLGFVIFAKSGVGQGLEVPLLQHLGKSKWASQRRGLGGRSYWDPGSPGSPLSPESPTQTGEDGDVDLGSPRSDDVRSGVSSAGSASEKWGTRRRTDGFWGKGADGLPRNGGNGSEATEGRPSSSSGSTSGHGKIRAYKPEMRFQAPTPAPTSPAESGPDEIVDTSALRPAEVYSNANSTETRSTTIELSEQASAHTLREGMSAEEDRFEEEEVEEAFEDESSENDDEVVLPKETRSSPSTPSGSRDREHLDILGAGLAQEVHVPAWNGSGDEI